MSDSGSAYRGSNPCLPANVTGWFSVSRVDPLPHQLEAIYDYMLKLPRVRFLLDDAGSGKTIMAGLRL